jgi:hypothetical protein
MMPEVHRRYSVLSHEASCSHSYSSHVLSVSCQGRAIAQVVSRWLPTKVARVRSRVWSSGISGGQSGAGAGFL